MSRTIADVERSLMQQRSDLRAAVADLRAGADQTQRRLTSTVHVASETAREYSEKAKDVREQALGRVDGARRMSEFRPTDVGEVQVNGGLVMAGFVIGGGVGGLLAAPGRLVDLLMSVVTLPLRLVGLPFSGSGRGEVVVVRTREDRYSRQLGRALAGVASADRQLRSGRRRRLVRNVRRLAMLGGAAGGVVVALGQDGELRDEIAKQGDRIVDRLLAA
ncbi:MAG TPA: hypothetical protein VHX88_14340 [Solirubrobacteraceae bacterium]|jgi:hypothetical protein|nr:hypothetical protein [Solirubrobacteraceae bacterium]